MATSASWARDAVIYQIYPRSFADSDGDGVGDLPGVISRLDYLADLGVDAVWLSPFFPSPMVDGGYDVADYRGVDPVFGTMHDVDRLVAQAHQRDIKIIIDLVPNHTSDQHPWFPQALADGPSGPARQRYIFRDGRDGGASPPNNWHSMFGGPAWTRVADGQWYLHLFAAEQPDLNWDHPQVLAEFTDILRFWLDRGIDGMRIDVAHGLVKAPGLPDEDPSVGFLERQDKPYWDQEGVHEIYREWRKILDGYSPERILVAEAWIPDQRRLARYVRPDELHQAFNFPFLTTAWSATGYREVIDESLAATGQVAAPATWVLSNHDVVRHASRLGLARARAATLLMLALPGSAYLYQGEELGLPEVFDLPDELRQDPTFRRSNGQRYGRDGCRVPLPWSGTAPPYGFSTGTPWLPQPAQWARHSAQAQRADPSSTWSMYRAALRQRRRLRLGQGELTWRASPGPEVLAFERPGLVCATNLGQAPVALPEAHGEVLLASGELPEARVLPAHTTVWWAT